MAARSDDPADRLEVAPGLAVPQRLLQFTFSRSSGPGGQNVNKLNTRATLTVELDALAPHLTFPVDRLCRLAGRQCTGDRLIIASDAHRSQIANRKECLEKLRQLILRARVRPRTRKPTRPTRGSVERRLDHKKQRGQIKRRRRRPPPDAGR
jgi:ribosome-associated protein